MLSSEKCQRIRQKPLKYVVEENEMKIGPGRIHTQKSSSQRKEID